MFELHTMNMQFEDLIWLVGEGFVFLWYSVISNSKADVVLMIMYENLESVNK